MTDALPVELELRTARAVEILTAGGLVAYPTDTLYGLGANAFLEPAVAKVFAVKRRPPDQPLPLLLADAGQLDWVAQDIPEIARRLADAYWPGALTLVVPRAACVPLLVTGGAPTVGVRVPAHPVPRELARRLAAPLTGTSANRSGGPSPTTADEVRAQLGADVDLIIDGGPCALGTPSTIVDVSSEPPRVLRVGAVTLADLGRRFPGVRWSAAGGPALF